MKKFTSLFTILFLIIVLQGCFFNKKEEVADVTEKVSAESTNTAESDRERSEALDADNSTARPPSEEAPDEPTIDTSPKVLDGTIEYDAETTPEGGEMGYAPDKEDSTLITTRGKYLDYSAEQFATLKGTSPVALFFHASWCSECTALDKAINENIADIPSGTTILKVNFDTEKELASTYAVYSQSTLVIFDKRGLVINKLFSPSFEKVRTELMAGKL